MEVARRLLTAARSLPGAEISLSSQIFSGAQCVRRGLIVYHNRLTAQQRLWWMRFYAGEPGSPWERAPHVSPVPAAGI